jgi:protein-S-isoprenylcysteine O-methyltransferase Ste14
VIFETGFLWILLAGLIYGAIHSAFASAKVKEWVAVQLGITNEKVYRLIYVLQSFIFTIIYLSIVFLMPDALIYAIPLPWVFLNLVIEAAAAVCIVLTLLQTGIFAFLGIDTFLPKEMVKQPAALHTSGFYRFVRHPLYLFSLIFLWLFPWMTWNVLAFNIGSTLYLIIGSIFEERKLVREFGDQYLEYKKRVPAFLPHF